MKCSRCGKEKEIERELTIQPINKLIKLCVKCFDFFCHVHNDDCKWHDPIYPEDWVIPE